ncbi:MAG: hypothetical protein J6K89_09820 [Oscillospiraceae bacterium]|nr:hypothetical protein [Oscillospiraceae bacterium]
MSSSQLHRISIFDICELVIPQGLIYHSDGQPGQRVCFLSDDKESFVISFEEGMEPIDLRWTVQLAESPLYSAQICKDGKYIHMCRYSNSKGTVAFFHMELMDGDSRKLCLPGQMISGADYRWSDGVEPILMELMDRLTILSNKAMP